MNCNTVRDRLMNAATDTFSELEPHLSSCVSCQTFADRILAAEQETGQELDAFMTARPPDWERLGIEEPRRRWGLHGVVLGLATAAVLLLAALPALQDKPGDPRASGSVPESVVLADEEFEDLLSIDLTAIELDDLAREDQDAALTGTLSLKSEALMATQGAYDEAYDEAVEAEDWEWQVEILLTLGEAYDDMAYGLTHMVHPSYLTERQHQIYQMSLDDKAWTQTEKALESYRMALSTAEEAGFEDWADEIANLIEGIEADIEAEKIEWEAQSEAREAKKLERARMVEPEMRALLTKLRHSLENCEVDPADVEDVEEAIQSAEEAIAADNVAMYPDITKYLSEVESSHAVGCPASPPLEPLTFSTAKVFHHSELEVKERVMPTYPVEAKELNLGDQRCLVRVHISEEGVPTYVRVEDCPKIFHANTRSGLMQWRWQPPRDGEQKIEAQTTIAVKYKLR